jgi:hypothetical protein
MSLLLEEKRQGLTTAPSICSSPNALYRSIAVPGRIMRNGHNARQAARAIAQASPLRGLLLYNTLLLNRLHKAHPFAFKRSVAPIKDSCYFDLKIHCHLLDPMLDCEVKNGWLQFIEFIQTRCTRTEFDNWFAPIQMISGNAEEIVLEVPNIFVQEYLLNNYKDLLREFIPLTSDRELALTFVIAPPQKTAAIIKPAEEPPIIETHGYELKLNPTYHFENFIEGPSNQFVKSAALGVAARPGKTYNPLFIHGGVGLGKTHLLHAIGHTIHKEQKKLKIQAITTEAFINDIVDSLRSKSIDRMKRFYRTLDVLLVDDIQFLQNRLNFEEEFCNTFEILINQNVRADDRPHGMGFGGPYGYSRSGNPRRHH